MIALWPTRRAEQYAYHRKQHKRGLNVEQTSTKDATGPVSLRSYSEWEPISELSALIHKAMFEKKLTAREWAQRSDIAPGTAGQLRNGFPRNFRATLKALNALGYTLQIVPIEQKSNGGRTRKKR